MQLCFSNFKALDSSPDKVSTQVLGTIEEIAVIAIFKERIKQLADDIENQLNAPKK